MEEQTSAGVITTKQAIEVEQAPADLQHAAFEEEQPTEPRQLQAELVQQEQKQESSVEPQRPAEQQQQQESPVESKELKMEQQQPPAELQQQPPTETQQQPSAHPPQSSTEEEQPTATEEQTLSHNFSIGSSGYVRDGPLLYLSKIVDIDDNDHTCFVHFIGWNKEWDYWMPIKNFLPHTPENEQLCRELKQAQKEEQQQAQQKKGRKSKPSSAPVSTNKPATPKRAKLTPPLPKLKVRKTCEVEDFTLECSLVKLPLPEELKKRALKDHDNVVIRNQPCLLPSVSGKSTVHTIFEVFLDTKKSSQVESFGQFCEAMEHYFNLVAFNLLLYPVEKSRFSTLLDKKASEVCGGEYLLRFLIRLPHLLQASALSDDELKLVTSKAVDLSRYITKYSRAIFVNEDDQAEYLRNAQQQ